MSFFVSDSNGCQYAGQIAVGLDPFHFAGFDQRRDNSPEYVSARLQNWAETVGIGLIYIQPGKPQQNAYVERYNRTVRTEWLGRYHFNSIEEVQEHATRRLWTYNNERPNGDRRDDQMGQSLMAYRRAT